MLEFPHHTDWSRSLQIDFLAVGNVTRDIAPEGFRLGGTVSFAAVTASRLPSRDSDRAALDGLVPQPNRSVRRPSNQRPPRNALASIPIRHAVDGDDDLRQYLSRERPGAGDPGHRRSGSGDTEEACPPNGQARRSSCWATSRESRPFGPACFRALLGITPQGLVRRWDEAGHVAPGPWDDAEAFLACWRGDPGPGGCGR